MRDHYIKLSACVILVIAALLIFNGYSKKNALPQPDFPLSEFELTAALEETGLSWNIQQADEFTDGATTTITYSLHLPGTKKEYNSVTIISFDSKELGRRLQIYFNEPQNKQWRLEETNACWEDWHEMLVLIARLYGGFEDAEEIYRACSAGDFPQDTYVLWQGTLTGGYFRMETFNPMKPERFSMGNTLRFDLYESEDAYLQFRQMVSDNKK